MTFDRLILASASPRRRELIALFGLPYEIVPSRYEEPSAPEGTIDLAAFVSELAVNKAAEVAARTENGIVIGADTLVAIDETDPHSSTDGSTGRLFGTPLGKPIDAADACRMLRLLSGRSHSVYTGVALIRVTNGEIDEPLTAVERTVVRFRALTEAMIEKYVATGEPLDKAGAYGAQGFAAPFIESHNGDFFNVVGLPLCALGRLLERAGVEWWQVQTIVPSHG